MTLKITDLDEQLNDLLAQLDGLQPQLVAYKSKQAILEEEVLSSKNDKSRMQHELDEVRNLLNDQLEKSNQLEYQINVLRTEKTCHASEHNLKDKRIKELEKQKQELQFELENSEEMRKQLKQDLKEANHRFVQLEEELYESKTIQLELLENLKQAEDNLEKYIMENEGKYDKL